MKINDHTIFRIGLGAMPLSISGRPSEDDALHVIETFVANGGNFIDTADVYGLDIADRGHNEKLIHKALKKLGARHKVLVSTKGGATRPEGGWGLDGGHPDELRAACEMSLKNLNVSSHELYYLHGPDPDVPLAESLGELIKLKQEGKIINIGIANVTLGELELACSLTTIAAVQNRCNPFCKGDFKNGLVEFCRVKNILYVPYCPLGGWADHALLAESEYYGSLENKNKLSPYTLSLSWLLSKSDHIIPIPGMDKSDHVTMNFQSVAIALDKEDLKRIDGFPDMYSPKHLD